MLTASLVWCVTRSEKLSTHCALNAIHDDGDLRATDVAELEALWSEGPGGSLQKDSGTAWQPYDRVGKRCARLGPGVRGVGGGARVYSLHTQILRYSHTRHGGDTRDFYTRILACAGDGPLLVGVAPKIVLWCAPGSHMTFWPKNSATVDALDTARQAGAAQQDSSRGVCLVFQEGAQAP